MKKGFTLIELLAVIIILAVIALISTPIVLDVVENAKEESRIQSVNGMIDATRLYANEAMLNESLILEGNLYNTIKDRVQGKLPKNGEIYVNENNQVAVAIKLDKYCYKKDYAGEITKTEDTNCIIGKIVEDVCYDVETTTYDINYDKCIRIFSIVLDDYAENEVVSVCKGGSTSDGYSIDRSVMNGKYTYEYLESENIISNVRKEVKCLSCFAGENKVESYDINYDTCMSSLAIKYPSYDENDRNLICTGSSTTEEINIDTIVSNGEFTYEQLIDIGVITNIKYGEETSIYEYRCYENNPYGMPTITDIKIPTSLNDLTVTQIAGNTFKEKQITNVDLSGLTNLEMIGSSAFKNNQLTGLLDLNNLKKLKIIGDSAFYGNSISGTLNLSSLTNLTTIGDSAFEGNRLTGGLDLSGLTKLTTIGDSAFEGNQLTGELDLSGLAKLTTIGDWAFYGNQLTGGLDLGGLTNLVTIGERSFRENKLDGLLNLSGLTNLTTIGAHAFAGNFLNGTLDLSDLTSLTTIGAQAFYQNRLSGTLDFSKLINLKTIESWAFGNNQLSGTLDLSGLSNLTTISPGAFAVNQFDKLNLNNLTNVTEIGFMAFYGNNISGMLDLSNLTGLATIKYQAFQLNNIEEIKLPVSITTIGEDAFSSSDLTSNRVITLPDGTEKTITHYNNPNLSKIVNPTGLAFDWNAIVKRTTGTSFETGSVTTSDNRTITITKE